ncbi:MAG: hypothetical protein EPN85_11900 [Bacteroidetes bacterium]|nr:MAG: hypothetical protein EPN85_11900 [Bacteroidota bacterium]
MKASEDIHALIKSLAPTEKAYFKKYARLHVLGKGNRYVLLFDAINKQKKYDEKELMELFKGYDFVKRFAVAKEYLYKQIRYALESYHHSIHSDMKSLLHWAEILCTKELYKQSHKAILKAKQIAREHEMHHALMEIFRYWEIKLAVKNSDVSWIQNILREEEAEITLLRNTKSYRDNYFRISNHYLLHGIMRGKKHFGEIKKIMQSRPLTDADMAKTFEAKLRFHATHAFYSGIIDDRRGLYHSSGNIIALFKKHPEKIRHAVGPFIFHLHNMTDACVLNKRYHEIPAHLKEFELLAPLAKSSDEKKKLFYFTAINRLNYYAVTGQFSIAVSAAVEISKQLGGYEQSMNDYEKAMLFQNIAMSYFGEGQYKNCIHWLNRIRDEISLNIRPDLEGFLRLFYVIAHYEAGHMDLLVPLIQSLYRYLKKKEQLHKFETVIIYFLRNELPKTNDQKERIQAFQKLKTKLLPLTKDADEKNSFDSFDYISWLESKIENRPFAEVVRQKAAEGGGSGKGNG